MKSGASGQEGGAAALDALIIHYRGLPNPPHEGDNEIEVSVKQQNGTPIADADVTVTYYMAAMASMNMPEMRNVFPLAPRGDGIYSGHAFLSMGGTWLVTVSVAEGGKPLGKKEFAVIAN